MCANRLFWTLKIPAAATYPSVSLGSMRCVGWVLLILGAKKTKKKKRMSGSLYIVANRFNNWVKELFQLEPPDDLHIGGSALRYTLLCRPRAWLPIVENPIDLSAHFRFVNLCQSAPVSYELPSD